jgi:hypothetical protein
MQTPPVPPSSDQTDEPLPLTLRFVFVLGTSIAVGWFAMFALLQERW